MQRFTDVSHMHVMRDTCTLIIHILGDQDATLALYSYGSGSNTSQMSHGKTNRLRNVHVIAWSPYV